MRTPRDDDTSARRFDDRGAGPVVLLLHGHPFDRTMWQPQLDALAAEGLRVVAPDLYGYGSAAAPPPGSVVTMGDLARDVLDLLDRLGIERFAPVGLSMGGLVAMELATAATARVWALGLVATTAQPLTAEERAQRLETAERAEREGMAPLADAMNARLYGPRCPDDVVAKVDAMMRANPPTGAAAALRGRARRPDYRPALRDLDVPAFVCVGTADSWSTAEVTEELVASLRRPTVVTLPDVGHLPNLEAPEAFNTALVRFLAAHARD
jgi:pimeloyl-ACP methyl ester carboxylesterase